MKKKIMGFMPSERCDFLHENRETVLVDIRFVFFAFSIDKGMYYT